MQRVLSLLLSILLLSLPLAVSATGYIPQQQWQPRIVDEFIVDVDSNTGYLLHADGGYMAFPLATGQQRTIHYLGINYFASTPLSSWIAKDEMIQTDRVDFGITGRFLRLYKNGSERTAYGIHGYKYFKKWLKDDTRYKSLGCIVVSEDMLDIIEATYRINGNRLNVQTTYGPQKLLDELTAIEQQTQAMN